MTATRRGRTARLIVALVSMALIAAACDGGSGTGTTVTDPATVAPPTSLAPATSTTTEAPTETPSANAKPYGGTIVTSLAQEPPTLNSFAPGGQTGVGRLIGNGYARGVQRVNGYTLAYEPDLVEELPTVANGGVVVNPDGTMTVSYRIRDDAVWSDGVPITGADIQFTLDTIRDEGVGRSKAVYEDITATEVGDKVFSFTLPAPTTKYERLFNEIIPQHAVDGSNVAEDWNTSRWPSNGPFIFAEWEIGEFIRLERNPNYFKTDPDTGQLLPFVDEIIFRFIPNTEDELNTFADGQTDVIQPDPATDVIEQLQNLEAEGVVTEVLPGPLWEHMNFQFGPNNRNAESMNEHLSFRRAIAHAIDKEALVEEFIGGQLEPLRSFVEPYNAAISKRPWADYDYNPERAADLLSQACADAGRDCAADPITVVFTTTSNSARSRLAEIIGEYLTPLGIEYEIDLENSQLYFGDTLNGGTWDQGVWAYISAPGMAALIDLLDVWDPEQPCPEFPNTNCYQWGTPTSSVQNANTERYAALRDEANQTVDVDELTALVQEAEQLLADEMVLIPLYSRLSVASVWTDEVGGFKHNPTAQGYTWNVGEWYRRDL